MKKIWNAEEKLQYERLLKEKGYQVKSAQAADLFPRCAHVESIVCLVKQ